MWEWRLSERPEYCRETCRPHFEQTQGDLPPCLDCPDAQPPLMAANVLPDRVISACWGARNSDGGLSWESLFRYMDLEGLDPEAQRDTFEKAQIAESVARAVAAEKRKAELEKARKK